MPKAIVKNGAVFSLVVFTFGLLAFLRLDG